MAAANMGDSALSVEESLKARRSGIKSSVPSYLSLSIISVDQGKRFSTHCVENVRVRFIETLFDCVVNGTKKNPVIIIDGDGPDKGRLLRKNKTILDKWTNAEYNPNCTYVTILLFELKNALKSKDSSLLTALHRLLLSRVNNPRSP